MSPVEREFLGVVDAAILRQIMEGRIGHEHLALTPRSASNEELFRLVRHPDGRETICGHELLPVGSLVAGDRIERAGLSGFGDRS